MDDLDRFTIDEQAEKNDGSDADNTDHDSFAKKCRLVSDESIQSLSPLCSN
jgi:hypothetical protein